MKCIIFESPDRCGKDSHIEALTEGLRNYTIRHWTYPQGKTNDDKTAWQKRVFHDEFSHYLFLRTRFPEHTLFWNRAHLGELVYGKIYRDSDPDSWVPPLEVVYGMAQDPDVYLIHLTADPEFLVKEDDGKSYSSDLENKRLETKAFQQAVVNSKIQNKITIKINNGDKYCDFNAISEEIRSFIGL